MKSNRVLAGLGLALLAALGYGANVPFAKQAAIAGVSGPDIVFYRAFLLLAVLAGLVLAGGGSLAVPAAARRMVLGLGLFTAFVALCYISSIAFIPVSVATIVFYTFPLVILVISPFIDGEALTPARIAIFILAFLGLFVAIGPRFTSLDPRGLMLAGGAVLGATGQFFFAARATRAVDPAVAGFWTQLILIPVALGACLLTGGPVPPAALLVAIVPVGLTCLLFIFAFSLHLASARLAPPAALGLIFCAEPVTSIMVATHVLDEQLTTAQVSGGSLVLIAILAGVLLEGRKPVPA